VPLKLALGETDWVVTLAMIGMCVVAFKGFIFSFGVHIYTGFFSASWLSEGGVEEPQADGWLGAGVLF